MAHGSNCKARLASARNAAQQLCITRTFMDTSFTPVGGFEVDHWEHVGAGNRLLQRGLSSCATRGATRPVTARPPPLRVPHRQHLSGRLPLVRGAGLRAGTEGLLKFTKAGRSGSLPLGPGPAGLSGRTS
jgi:hypothetical protein